ncbi:unnamed protein product [Sphagnum troendelagicum]|uniref:C2H2-type domain-containing protein n=1 Tax=Sphagnum troendelagicum TaxID=128251 RepID=A0ABP0T9Z5_9BRYO
MTLSNITCSASAGEASGSSGTRTTDDGNTAPPAATPATTTTTVSSGQPPGPGQKRKRNLPGTPDPEAEVVALSPKTLMATNRFVCEICNKGFQRDQNLQLHRRGHNLPWKLRQRSSKEIIRKRVYICPETSCVHHDPSRALGDLTGIKKHFCRKHGEKKWKCDKCSKRYAVQSDWKAHSKTCGTREYRCDCGTLFSRRDSFITHRAFCDALAEESARVSAGKQYGGSGGGDMMSSSSMMMQATQVGGSMSVLAGTLSLTSSPHHGNNMNLGRVTGGLPAPGSQQVQLLPAASDVSSSSPFLMQPPKVAMHDGGAAGLQPAILNPLEYDIPQAPRPTSSSGLLLPMVSSGTGSLFAHLFSSAPGSTMPGLHGGSSSTNNNIPANTAATAQMSATALLQKAAQMGATARGMMQPPNNNHHHHHHRMLPNDVMAHHHNNNNPYHSGGGGGPMSQGMGGQPSSMLQGLGGSTRGEDGSDRFTHDFLGVGGAPSGMAAAAGGMGRTLSQRDLASLASLGPGVDLGAIFNQRENLRSVGASVHSPAKSWDAS